MKTVEQIKKEIEGYEELCEHVDLIQRRACRAKINVLEWVLK